MGASEVAAADAAATVAGTENGADALTGTAVADSHSSMTIHAFQLRNFVFLVKASPENILLCLFSFFRL